jgi:hypothetical protein
MYPYYRRNKCVEANYLPFTLTEATPLSGFFLFFILGIAIKIAQTLIL